MQEAWREVWDVESDTEEAGRVRVSLVRRREHDSRKHLMARTETVEHTVFFSRSFRSMLDAIELEHFTAKLQLLARFAIDGQFGCFVQTQSDAGSVAIILYERSFDGTEIRTEELARRTFDAGDESSLVASTEFLADLRIWADQRNDARDTVLAEQRDDAEIQARITGEREAAGAELREILAAHINAD